MPACAHQGAESRRIGPSHASKSDATGWLQIQPLANRLPVTEEAHGWRVGCGVRVGLVKFSDMRIYTRTPTGAKVAR